MSIMKKIISLLSVFSICMLGVTAQDQAVSKYDPNELFNPLFYKEHGNNIRTGNGEPGKGYWQNRADYSINAILNDETNQVKGTVTLSYTNNSPHQLGFLVAARSKPVQSQLQGFCQTASNGEKQIWKCCQSLLGRIPYCLCKSPESNWLQMDRK